MAEVYIHKMLIYGIEQFRVCFHGNSLAMTAKLLQVLFR